VKPNRIIVNPAAGSGAGQRSLDRIRELVAETSLDCDILVTEQPGHAIELSLEAAEAGCQMVVAAGGDGTVNEVVNGLMAAKLAAAGLTGGQIPCMGVLCVGRGNDFAASVGVPYELEQGVNALVKGHTRTIDIGLVRGGKHPEGRYFANCVGMGFDAITTIETAKLPRLGGFLSFFLGVLKTIILYNEAPLATITYDGRTITQRSLMISIMNGVRLGGGFIMAPDSQMDDGLLDLCIAHQVSRPRVLTMLPHFMQGSQATQPEIATVRAREVSIVSDDGPLPAHTDGEIISVDGRSLDIELLSSQLQVIVTEKL
jgi:YegS/Rv2252/BmrU family lipid kinase